MSDDANSLLNQYGILWQEQANFRTLWNTTAQFVMPAWDNFIGEFAPGVNRNTRIFDSTAILGNERFGSAMEALGTPRGSTWHKMNPGDEELKDDPETERWLDQVNKILWDSRYHPEANFASQTDECYLSLGGFGNDCLFVDEVPGKCLRYRSWPLSELCWTINHQGMVDTIYRKFKYSPKQAIQHWGQDGVPQSIRDTFKKNPFAQQLEFLQVIQPNQEYVEGRYGDMGKRYEGWYIHLGDKSVIERGGYRVFPCAIGRYRVAPREMYGRGPAITCLPDIRTANEMQKTGLRLGQKAADPPVLLAEESVLNNFNQRPGANNYGMVSADGKPLAIPWESKGNFQVSAELQQDVRTTIRETFLNTLFKILVDHPDMTATQALLLAQEKGELIAPVMGRMQSEFLGPLITRELDILKNAGQLPPMPLQLAQSRRGVTIEYTSPLARAMKAEEGSAIMNTVQDIATMAQIDPTVKTIIDFHEAARTMARIRGMPAKLVRSDEEVDQILQQAQQAQEQSQALAQAPMVSQSALNLAKAAQLSGGAGASPGAPSVQQ